MEASTQIGVGLVRREAEAIEEACHRGDVASAIERMPQLEFEWQKACAFLRHRLEQSAMAQDKQ